MTKTVEASKLVPIRKASEILGVRPITVRRWSDRGLLPHTRQPSGHRMFDPEELLRVRRTMALSNKMSISVCVRRRDIHDLAAFATQNCLIDDPKSLVSHRHYSLTESQSTGKMVEMIVSGEYNKILVRNLQDWSTVDPSLVLTDLCLKHHVALFFCHVD